MPGRTNGDGCGGKYRRVDLVPVTVRDDFRIDPHPAAQLFGDGNSFGCIGNEDWNAGAFDLGHDGADPKDLAAVQSDSHAAVVNLFEPLPAQPVQLPVRGGLRLAGKVDPGARADLYETLALESHVGRRNRLSVDVFAGRDLADAGQTVARPGEPEETAVLDTVAEMFEDQAAGFTLWNQGLPLRS